MPQQKISLKNKLQVHEAFRCLKGQKRKQVLFCLLQKRAPVSKVFNSQSLPCQTQEQRTLECFEMDYEYIVVGAGINGSWAGYHLAKMAKKVLVIEQVRNILYSVSL